MASSTLQIGLSSSMSGTEQWLSQCLLTLNLWSFQHLIQNSKGAPQPPHMVSELFGLSLDTLPNLTWPSVTASLLEPPSGQAEGPPLVLSCSLSFVHSAFFTCNTLSPKYILPTSYILPTLQEAAPVPPPPWSCSWSHQPDASSPKWGESTLLFSLSFSFWKFLSFKYTPS